MESIGDPKALCPQDEPSRAEAPYDVLSGDKEARRRLMCHKPCQGGKGGLHFTCFVVFFPADPLTMVNNGSCCAVVVEKKVGEEGEFL